MNTQEHSLLTDLLNNLDQAASQLAPPAKDAEADQLIRQALAARPEIAYLLVQRQLLLEQAMQNAQARIQQLEQAESASKSTDRGSFLGGAVGASSGAANVYGQSMSNPAPVRQEQAVNSAASGAAAATPPPRPGALGGSFLGTAAAAATGVVGGALLFQGIEHLMGGGWGGNTVPADTSNITENFYGTDASPASDAMNAPGSGWSNTSTGADSGFDDPASNPIDPSSSGLGDGVDQAAWDDTGDSGGLFDGLFGDGGDDGWL